MKIKICYKNEVVNDTKTNLNMLPNCLTFKEQFIYQPVTFSTKTGNRGKLLAWLSPEVKKNLRKGTVKGRAQGVSLSL